MAGKSTYEELENKLHVLEKKMVERNRVEVALQKRMHDLDKRVKGLNCLYGISHLVEKGDMSFGRVAQGTVDLIAAAWQYPEITCARIILRGREFKTKNFKKTRWKQTSDIIVQAKIIGVVEVYYLDEKTASDEGPFLKEERTLINTVAGRIGRISEWMQTGKEVKLLKEKYEDLYNNAPVMYLSLDHNGIVVECNNIVLDTLGYTKNEFMGKHITQFVTPKSAVEFKKGFPELMETGKLMGAERQLVTGNGEIVDTILNVTVEYNEQGKPLKTRSTFENITHRKRAEEALRQSEQKYRSLLETTSEGCWRINPEFETIEVNQALCRMLGYSPDEMLGKTPFDFVDEDNRKIFLEQTSKIFTTHHRSYEITLKKKNGEDIETFFNSSTMRDESGDVTGAFALITEITERKRMEAALYRSEAQKQAILDVSIDRLRYVDKDMKIIWANQTTVMGMDVSPADIVGQTCYKLLAGRDTPCNGCPNVTALETGKTERAVTYRPDTSGKKGESFWDTYIVPLKDKAGDIENFIQIARDITDQQKAKKRIHMLSHELIKAQENERKIISRELHDRVAQDLSALKIECDMLLKGRQVLPREIGKKINGISTALQGAITTIRDLSYELRPAGLDQMGLSETIFQYCEEFSEKTGLRMDFASAGMDGVTLNFDTEINLYRLVQEGLNNIRKHADANHVTVRLAAAYPSILLRIIDDGKGFDVKERLANAFNEKRMGLRSMEERTHLLHGSLDIQSRPAQGTKILIIIPQQEKKSDQ